MEGSPYLSARHEMVDRQLRARGIQDEYVLDAMRRVPRHEFVPEPHRAEAYRDCALPIDHDQTISQPYIVALMTQALHLKGNETVLEIGTGSGYQTAVLCELAREVFSLERYRYLASKAAATLDSLGYENFEIHVGDGSQGLPDMAPFDAIIVTAAAPALPGPLRAQLSTEGGRLVIPVGSRDNQHLERVTRHGSSWSIEQTERVRFVPLLGRYGFERTHHADNDLADV